MLHGVTLQVRWIDGLTLQVERRGVVVQAWWWQKQPACKPQQPCRLPL